MTFDFKRIVFTTLNFTPCFVSTNIIKLFFVFSENEGHIYSAEKN